MTEALLRTVCLPKRIWEPCCGDGAMARVLESHGHHVVATDLVDRGYGEGGPGLPDGIPVARWRHRDRDKSAVWRGMARKFVDHALELMLPVGGMVAMLMNVQWQTAKKNSARCRIPAFDASVILTDRIVWIPDTDVRGSGEPLLDGVGLLAHARPGRAAVCRPGCGIRTRDTLVHRVPGAASVDGPRRQAALLAKMSAALQP